MLATGKPLFNAPVLIFTYNRLDHIQQTITTLSKNMLSHDSDIYIFSDAPKNDAANEAVMDVRNYLHSLSGFKKITIIERNENYGLAKNIIEGVTDIINQYGKVIVLEDDLLTSKNFLSYMNEALNFYEKNEDIFAISGFCWNLPSLKNLNEDAFIAYRPASWGWATWKDQWENVDWQLNDYETFIKDKNAIKKFNRGGMDMTRMLSHYKAGKNNSWAIRWAYSMSKQDKYCIYPKLSKIQNIGFGDNATHCTGDHIHQTTLDDSTNTQFRFPKNPIIHKQLLNEFRYQNSYLNKAIKKISIKLKNIFKGR